MRKNHINEVTDNALQGEIVRAEDGIKCMKSSSVGHTRGKYNTHSQRASTNVPATRLPVIEDTRKHSLETAANT